MLVSASFHIFSSPRDIVGIVDFIGPRRLIHGPRSGSLAPGNVELKTSFSHRQCADSSDTKGTKGHQSSPRGLRQLTCRIEPSKRLYTKSGVLLKDLSLLSMCKL